ncbi:hypothetical protein M407DRAFT_228415 [Tulasnella calospora MUT 4182]|uniref:Uncharacterized protein n=1 Tax=Tulasnella calospora MUT 4182 TaxID=1051891 RepID=A0A0C3K7P0_9AGAM|nr:hypothetical protein M407DRAFT_228415 [Tulasnella calospora MUT 4182]
MRILSVFSTFSTALVVRSQTQVHLRTPGSDLSDETAGEWSTPPLSYETGWWIFHSVSGLMRHWPNILYRNGHSIIPGTIAPGTLLYHGRPESSRPPPGPEWVSFDPEHSYIFGRSVYTYIVGEEPLKILYFDGSSASNMKTGTIDTQEILLHGEIREGGWIDENNRLKELCEWGREFGLQGFVRPLPFISEVMLCDFQRGVRHVSSLDLLPPDCDDQPDGPWPEPPIPHGWKGSLSDVASVAFEAIQAGNWHNRAPGVNGLTLDYSGMVSFFDPKYTSLARARDGVDRKRWRVGNITTEDVELFRNELQDVLTRGEKGSGVKWDGIVRSLVDRHAGRLEFLSDWLGDGTNNSTYSIKHARRAVLTMLAPYLSVTSIPLDHKTNTTWLDPAIHYCSTTFTAHLPVHQFTLQEHRIGGAVEAVMREICWTVGNIWIDAFDAEGLQDETERRCLLIKWKANVDRLMDWLGWTEWVKCKPACKQYEMCSLPQWPFDMCGMDPEPEISYTPKCMSRIEQDLGGSQWM